MITNLWKGLCDKTKKGPIGKPIIVSSKNEWKSIFGNPYQSDYDHILQRLEPNYYKIDNYWSQLYHPINKKSNTK